MDARASWFARNSLYFAWIVSLAATGGSLYFSEIANYIPCNLCWFQRIFMYPQVILLGIAAYRGDRGIIRYSLPLSIIGGIISVYHNLEIWFPKLAEVAPCRAGVPCTFNYVNWFGFITIPLMALTAFVLITLCLSFGRAGRQQ
ncbi:disulfide oxidoreductase [Paenibacillus protaetiae]|uniref:Disulfide bond formation protein B n=1 Tax=Paenibacillus protaetiae TaxID=2509456 RepID=A0A4P6EVJ5_9BACL|nr:disulfide oxidoreductase [Paenibacillus protaetiae]QAY65699.1 disulfide bond formation protein B [Paenibacillus protaetiae]